MNKDRFVNPKAWATCLACGKRGWAHKKAAKIACRKMAGEQMSVYRCKRGGFTWHFGHLPDWVVSGRGSRGDLR